MRDLTRLFFKIALILLTMAGCTQTITWFGEETNPRPVRYNPTYRSGYSTSNNVEEVEEVSTDPVKDIGYNADYDY